MIFRMVLKIWTDPFHLKVWVNQLPLERNRRFSADETKMIIVHCTLHSFYICWISLSSATSDLVML